MKPEDELPADQFKRIVRQLAERRSAAGSTISGLGWWALSPVHALRTAARSAVRRVTAALSFDSQGMVPAAAGMRSLSGDTRHLLFSAKGRDIDLRIRPSAGSYVLSGQVLGPDEAGSVELATHIRGTGSALGYRATALDPLGEFHLDELDVGTYVLTLRVSGDEIVLPPIEVGATPN